MSDRATEYWNWFWTILLLLIVAISVLVTGWGNQPKYKDIMSAIDKYWERKVSLLHEVCDEEDCSWEAFKTEKLNGDSYRPIRWPEIRKPKSYERLEREETYWIDFLDSNDRVHTRKTHSYEEYQSCKLSSLHPVIINNFGGVREILPEAISD
ncbi:MAG: hypothetical protein J7647_28470 [Cyanobacteria bacterium SBLK]|nr:hypothetical protein [Cyanobacteria bacterium SBLK]